MSTQETQCNDKLSLKCMQWSSTLKPTDLIFKTKPRTTKLTCHLTFTMPP